MELITKIKNSLDKLEAYLDMTDLRGYDPYDALNSKILSGLSFNKKWLRIFYTQVLKKLPVNLRPFLFIARGYNPKGLGLFLSGYVKLFSLYKQEKYLQKIEYIISILDKVKSKGYSGDCWGYNFDWQSRDHFTPKGTPTIVNTVFIAHAFLDAYRLFAEDRFLQIARSSCDFIINDLLVSTADNLNRFGYTPCGSSKVYNANMLAVGLLARLYSIRRENKLLDIAKKAAEYVISKQNPDGSWYYADTNYQRWIDCHHTGFVLEGLLNYIKYSGDQIYLSNLTKGLEFFKNHFFSEYGVTKFYHDRDYPIDIHCPAQSIVTLVRLNESQDNSELLQKVTCWMIDHFQDDSGYFYYRKGRFFDNKIPYIRWSQAWAFHALTMLLKREQFNEN